MNRVIRLAWSWLPALGLAAAALSAPEITDVVPRRAWEGETVRIVGTGFSSDVSEILVTVGREEAHVVSASPTEIAFEVPVLASSGDLQVTSAGESTALEPFLVALPITFEDLTSLNVDPFTRDLLVTERGSARRVTRLEFDVDRDVTAHPVTGLNNPVGLPRDDSNRFYISNTTASLFNQGSIFRFTPDGSREFFRAAGRAASDPVAARALGLVDPSTDVVYFCDRLGRSIRKVPRFGRIDKYWASGLGFNDPGGLAVDDAGNVFVTADSRLLMFDPSGARTVVATGLSTPSGISLSADQDRVYVAEQGASRVVSVEVAGGGITELLTGLDRPRAVLFTDDSGQDVLWIAERERVVRLVVGQPVSNVAFIPGIQASRLYEPGFPEPDKLWEANSNAEMCRLRPNEDGTLRPGLFVRDIIDRGRPLTHTPLPDSALPEIYEGFMTYMDGLVADGVLQGWRALPYDWRDDVEVVARQGVPTETGQQSLVEMIENLAADSWTEKVTIVAHSNGGLLAKALISRLEATGRAELVDRLILVGSPQVGTPKAIAALLHGFDQGIPHFVDPHVAREAGEVLVGAYNLLPSPAYFEVVEDEPALRQVVRFGDGARPSAAPELRRHWQAYGDVVDAYGSDADGMRSFLVAGQVRRTELWTGPCEEAPEDDRPNLLRAPIIDQVEGIHGRLDPWSPPADVEVVQVVGSGLPTIAAVEYVTDLRCPDDPMRPCRRVMDYEIVQHPEGDETVVTPSAAAMPVETWYVDLPAHNRRTGEERSHASMMAAEPIRLVVGALLQDEDPGVLRDVRRDPVNAVRWNRVTLRSPAELHAFDGSGRHVGPVALDPGDSDVRLWETAIPNATYWAGGHSFLTLDDSDEYEVELRGTALATFTLVVELFEDAATIAEERWTDVPVAPGALAHLALGPVDGSARLRLDLDGDGSDDLVLGPSGEQPAVEDYLPALELLLSGLALPHGTQRSLIAKLESAGRALERGRVTAAAGSLRALAHELAAQRGKHVGEETAAALIRIVRTWAERLSER